MSAFTGFVRFYSYMIDAADAIRFAAITSTVGMDKQ